MKCPGCNGEVRGIGDLAQILDTQGYCVECHGVLLRNNTLVMAADFCKCQTVPIEQTTFYFRPDGRHGWLHLKCGQITQTG